MELPPQTFSHKSLVLIFLHDRESFLFGRVEQWEDLKEKTGREKNVKFEVPIGILPSKRGKNPRKYMEQAEKNEQAEEQKEKQRTWC